MRALPNFTLREAEDDSDRKLLADVTEFGWHVTHIPEDEEGPQYSFTVGLYYTFQHPELLIMGLRHPITHQVLTDAVADISTGRVFHLGTLSDRLFESCSCKFMAISKLEEALSRFADSVAR